MRLGYATGAFDLFHVGHLNFLKSAREQCDRLIVGVNTVEIIGVYKRIRPIIDFESRCRIVGAIRCVDEVVPRDVRDPRREWEKHRFDVMFVGSDWRGTDHFRMVEGVLESIGVAIVYLPYTPSVSSSLIKSMIRQCADVL